MNYKEVLLNEAKKMPLLCRRDGNWDLKFRFEDGKAVVYYIAKDPSQCNSGHFGDIAHIRCLMRTETADGLPVLDENSLTHEGRLLIEANGNQVLYEKLLSEKRKSDVV